MSTQRPQQHNNSTVKPVSQLQKSEKSFHSKKSLFSHLLISSTLLVDASGSQLWKEVCVRRKRKKREIINAKGKSVVCKRKAKRRSRNRIQIRKLFLLLSLSLLIQRDVIVESFFKRSKFFVFALKSGNEVYVEKI